LRLAKSLIERMHVGMYLIEGVYYCLRYLTLIKTANKERKERGRETLIQI